MLEEIEKKLQTQLSKEDYEYIKNKSLHLGIFTEPCLSFMLEGKKKIESRFSKKKILPYQKIKKDDIVLVKKASGKVVAYFTIKEVKFFDLKEIKIEKIKKEYNQFLCVEDSFWVLKKESCYGTLIFIDKIHLLKPFSITKKGMQTWILLGKIGI